MSTTPKVRKPYNTLQGVIFILTDQSSRMIVALGQSPACPRHATPNTDFCCRNDEEEFTPYASIPTDSSSLYPTYDVPALTSRHGRISWPSQAQEAEAPLAPPASLFGTTLSHPKAAPVKELAPSLPRSRRVRVVIPHHRSRSRRFYYTARRRRHRDALVCFPTRSKTPPQGRGLQKG